MNIPEEFNANIKAQFGNETGQKLIDSLSVEPTTSVRLNMAKVRRYSKVEFTPTLPSVAWCSTGFYLDNRIKFTFDPLFHAGAYYVQEASSMFIERIISKYITSDVVALDLCAAPGGKSTLLRGALTDNSLLISNEYIGKRAQILTENILKWGNPNTIVTNNAPKDYRNLKGIFDLVLADVPCSGEGMFRKDEQAVTEWSNNNITICKNRQLEIIADIWPTIKPGGLLIYSTCTFNRLENEDNVQTILNKYGAKTLPIELDKEWKIFISEFGEGEIAYRFLPHLVKGEGLFIAIIQKPFNTSERSIYISTKQSKKNKKGKGIDASVKLALETCSTWIENSEEYTLSLLEDYIYAISKKWSPYLNLLKSEKLHVLTAGVPLAHIKGKSLIPQHGLAMNITYSLAAFPTFEVNYEQAIAFLKKEAITLPATASNGYILLTYRNYPLGFIKNLGNRTNNLYPNEWRIRSGYIPDKIESIL